MNDLAMAQHIKVEILKDIQLAKSPFEILSRAIEYIAEQTEEPTFAEVAKKNLQSVYGTALAEPQLLTAELTAVEERLVKLEAAFHNESLSEEERKRIEYAVLAHKSRIKEINLAIADQKAAKAQQD